VAQALSVLDACELKEWLPLAKEERTMPGSTCYSQIAVKALEVQFREDVNALIG